MRDLSQDERKVVGRLGQAMNEFSRLNVIHEADRPEFVRMIQAAQNIVLARPGTEVAMGAGKERKKRAV